MITLKSHKRKELISESTMGLIQDTVWGFNVVRRGMRKTYYSGSHTLKSMGLYSTGSG